MEIGDLVRATWSDGLCVVGKFSEKKRGYIILHDECGRTIVCDPNHVKLEVIK